MFTGIVEETGTIVDIKNEETNKVFKVQSALSDKLEKNQSLAHNGACLSVTDIQKGTHSVTAIQETLDQTNLGQLQKGNSINLERALPANGRFEGHFVQAHVDEVATCEDITAQNGSWLFSFSISPQYRHLLIPKGSITVNGVSLTITEISHNTFSVAIIPATYNNTNLGQLKEGDPVNIEYDLLGKYISQLTNNTRHG